MYREKQEYKRLVQQIILVILGLFATGCGSDLETFAVITRPFVMTDPNTQSSDSEINGEARQLINSPRRIHFREGRTRNLPNGQAITTYPIAPELNGRDVAIIREMRRPHGAGHERLSPLVLRVENGSLKIPHPRKNKFRLSVSGLLIPDAHQAYTSKRFRVPEGAILQGSIGLSTIIPERQRAPARVRVSALLDRNNKQLLEKSLGTKDLKWEDYRIDLGAFSGQELRLVISVGPTSPQPQDRFNITLIGNPLVLAPETQKAPNFVVISLDTLRADHVGANERGHSLTPNLDRFAASGVVFRDAMTTFPSTTASHMSLFTGLYPSAHKVFEPGPRLQPRIKTLTAILAKNGYRTGAITENGMLMRSVGFGRGFDTYVELRNSEPLETPGFVSKVVDRAESWINRYGNERFFLFLHTYQVHAPYEPPAGFSPTKEQSAGFGPRRSAYAGEVIYTDREIGRFLDFLEQSGLSGTTTVLVTSDHGESFGEHGHVGHGSSLFEEELKIPLLLRSPNRSVPGLQVETLVSLIDIAPTILELAGIEPPAETQGRSLVRLSEGLEDEAVRHRAVYAQRRLKADRYVVAARKGKKKWISGPLDADANIVDLAADPDERAPRRSEQVRRQAEQLRSNYRKTGEALFETFGEAGAPVDLDAAARDRLRALGYVEVAESGLPENSPAQTPAD